MKFHRIYVEEAALSHARFAALRKRIRFDDQVVCQRYGEIFNPTGQNFRLQKQAPSIIVALKQGQRVLPTPPGYGLGADHHFYFSHMLNCLYDCRYCFLQGMYRSANYVYFANFEDFESDIDAILDEHPGQSCFFFSGYDCDSLAMESITGFADRFLPFFAERPNAWLELRTKSVNIRPLLEREAIPNIVTAFSLNPDPVARSLEHRAPPLEARLSAAAKLAEAGWPIGLRLDPLIYFPDWEIEYKSFINQIFSSLPVDHIHSATIGSFRSPKPIFKRMESLYPEEPLFAANLQERNGSVGYRGDIGETMETRVRALVSENLGSDRIFTCSS